MENKTVKEIRLANGLTQREMAQELGVALSTIAMVESGGRRVTDKLRFKIARRFPIDSGTATIIENAKKLEGVR